MLLEAGADVDAKDRRGATALFNVTDLYAGPDGTIYERVRDMRCLLDRGANASVRDCDGRTLLHRAVQTCDSDAYKRTGAPI